MANLATPALKEAARLKGLSASGTKAELLKRLHENDPTGQWIDEIINPTAAVDTSDILDAGGSADAGKTQARIQRFQENASVLEAFEKMRLPAEKKPFMKSEAHGSANTKTTLGASEPKASPTEKKPDSVPQGPHCFNCSKSGHFAADCKQPKREKGACFKCFSTDHQLPDCPEAKKEQVKFVSKLGGNDFYKIVKLDVNVGESSCCLQLDALLDTGSPISFVKQQVVPNVDINTKNVEPNWYVGLNNSNLEIRGKIMANVRFDGLVCEDINLWVVPNTTIKTSIILGRIKCV